MLTSEQHELRARGLGGSDAPVVCGLSPRMTAFELYLEKRGELPHEDRDDDVLSWLGHQSEPIIAGWYERDTGRRLRQVHKTQFSREHEFMLAHPDRLVVGERRGLEMKARQHTDGWGQSGSDDVPEDVLLQCQHYMAVTHREVWDVAAWFRGAEFRRYEIGADRGLIDNLIEIEAAFWRRVEHGTPPPLDHEHSSAVGLMQRLHPGTDGRIVTLPAAAMHWHEVYQDAKEHARRYEAAADTAKAHLLDSMGHAAVGQLPDGSAYHRKEVHRGAFQVEATTYVSFSHRRAARTR